MISHLSRFSYLAIKPKTIAVSELEDRIKELEEKQNQLELKLKNQEHRIVAIVKNIVHSISEKDTESLKASLGSLVSYFFWRRATVYIAASLTTLFTIYLMYRANKLFDQQNDLFTAQNALVEEQNENLLKQLRNDHIFFLEQSLYEQNYSREKREREIHKYSELLALNGDDTTITEVELGLGQYRGLHLENSSFNFEYDSNYFYMDNMPSIDNAILTNCKIKASGYWSLLGWIPTFVDIEHCKLLKLKVDNPQYVRIMNSEVEILADEIYPMIYSSKVYINSPRIPDNHIYNSSVYISPETWGYRDIHTIPLDFGSKQISADKFKIHGNDIFINPTKERTDTTMLHISNPILIDSWIHISEYSRIAVSGGTFVRSGFALDNASETSNYSIDFLEGWVGYHEYSDTLRIKTNDESDVRVIVNNSPFKHIAHPSNVEITEGSSEIW